MGISCLVLKQVYKIISRQGYYKGLKRKENNNFRKKKQEFLNSQRKQMPMLGCKKLKYLIDPEFKKQEIKIGRDKFFKLMTRIGLQVRRKAAVLTIEN